MFIGRPYCRFLCPYGVVLRLLARGSWKKVKIAPDKCINCRLCERSCPFGAIQIPTHTPRVLPVLEGKGTLVAMLIAAPLIVGVLAWVGYASGDTLSLLHREVQLAREVAAWDANPDAPYSDAVRSFIDSGKPPGELYAEVERLRGRFAVGALLVGVWMGVVVGAKLIAHSVRRRRDEYTADPGACLSCGRCFDDCPVELKRKGLITELPVVQELEAVR